MNTNEKLAPQAERDLASADSTRATARNFPAGVRRQTQVQVVIRQSVLNEIRRHGKSTTNVEVCGVLVGDLYRDERGPFVYVEACIRGHRADSHAAQVTFTAETWADIQGTLDREHAGLRIVGWYHTHPGFGIFLSAMDLFIHENFFNGCEQLALVFDPLHAEEGLFVWRGGQPVAEPFSVEPDATDEFPKTVVHVSPRPTMTAAATPSSDTELEPPGTDLSARLTDLERKQSQTTTWLLGGSLAFVVLLIFWPIALSVWLQPFITKSTIEKPVQEHPRSPDLKTRPAAIPKEHDRKTGPRKGADPAAATSSTVATRSHRPKKAKDSGEPNTDAKSIVPNETPDDNIKPPDDGESMPPTSNEGTSNH